MVQEWKIKKEVWDQHIHTTIYKIYIKQTIKALLCSAGKYMSILQ